MQLSTLAERLLLRPDIADKLAPVDGLQDDRRASSVTPEFPARPPGLRLDEDGPRPPFPRLSQLDDPVQRGRVLHFFANHELLAMELMALALLRFPDAEPAWRMGLAHTLLEEQDHMRRYLARMEELGVRFGSMPVSPFFWNVLKTMRHPRDVAVGLGLVFEQANLDWCRYYGAAVRELGDEETHALLERVYQDEVRHVAHSLKWFRRWKQAEASDWDAFVTAMELPLNPARARGKGFDRAGREAAGLAGDFIDRLQTFSRSRGRKPWVYRFNPGVEIEAAGRPLPGAVQDLRRDLAALPHVLASSDDIVLAPKQRVAFLRHLQEGGFVLPEFRPALPEDRPVAGLRPFGEPGEHLRRSLALPLQEGVRKVFRVEDLPSDGVLKSEFSSTGQGVRLGVDVAFAQRCIDRDGFVLVEPRRAIVFEFSALWWQGRFLGLSWPEVSRGRWVGHTLGTPRATPEVHRRLKDAEAFARGLEVPETCGVDVAMTPEGFAVLEVNARTTMGHYALFAHRRAPWARRFRLVKKSAVPAEAFCLTDPAAARTWVAILER